MTDRKARCPGCQKQVVNTYNSLKAHGWAKVACRASLPVEMRREIEAEEEAYNKDGVNRCPGCNKIVADMVDALKAHAFAKIECRGAVPVEMRREIEAEEEAYKKNGVSRCLGCHKIVANMGDALKAHAFAKVACRAAVPVEMRREIEAEQEAYKKSEVNRCPGCQKIVADSADTLKAHGWSKVACRVATPTETRREIEAEEQSHKMEDVSWCLGRQIEEKEVCLFARKRKSSAMPSEYERSICSGNGSPQGWGNGGWCDGSGWSGNEGRGNWGRGWWDSDMSSNCGRWQWAWVAGPPAQ